MMRNRFGSALLLGLKFGLIAVGFAAAVHVSGWLVSNLAVMAADCEEAESPQNAPFEGYFASRASLGALSGKYGSEGPIVIASTMVAPDLELSDRMLG
jgi:hypothetical protein